MDAGNLLKPASRGELRCIGATTLDEYRKHIEKDAAFERRFQPVFVDQPSVEGDDRDPPRAQAALRAHTACASSTARWSPRPSSNRYITDRFLPDKAIDLVDEAASRLRMENDPCPPNSTNSAAASCSSRSSARRSRSSQDRSKE